MKLQITCIINEKDYDLASMLCIKPSVPLETWQ